MLSLALGKTLSEIDAMPEAHLAEYQQFYQEQPFGLWREDYRTAQISQLLVAINRDPKTPAPLLADFMPFYDAKTEQDEQKAEQERINQNIAEFLAKR